MKRIPALIILAILSFVSVKLLFFRNESQKKTAEGSSTSRIAERNTATFQPGPSTRSGKPTKQNVHNIDSRNLSELFSTLKWEGLSENDLLQKQSEILEELVARGEYEAGKSLALQYDAGSHREALIYALFRKSDAPLKDLFEKCKDPGFAEDDKEAVVSGIRHNVAESDGFRRVSNLLKERYDISNDQLQNIAVGLLVDINPNRFDPSYYDGQNKTVQLSEREKASLLKNVEKMFKELGQISPIHDGLLQKTLIQATTGSMPDESMAIFVRNSDKLDPTDRTQLGNDLMLRLFHKNPIEALSGLSSLKGMVNTSEIVEPGIKDWLSRDSKAVSSWLSEQGSSLDAETFDQVSKTAANYFAGKNDVDQASAIISRIKDPGVRSAAEQSLANQQADRYQNEARKDLQGHLTALVDPNSDKPGNYIERTFGSLIEKDPVEAQKWYESHWNALPKEKAQYVAAAYAKASLKQKDIDVATQWAGYITDSKTKQRIEAEIRRVTEAGN
jgi:hypothetical protein